MLSSARKERNIPIETGVEELPARFILLSFLKKILNNKVFEKYVLTIPYNFLGTPYILFLFV